MSPESQMVGGAPLPVGLVRQVREGRTVLLFGAGATYGATLPDGKEPPLGEELGKLLSAEFLDGAESGEELAWIAELAISTADLFDVQDFIAERFRDLKPADFHRLLPAFRWKGLATTNYDRLVETVYADDKDRTQAVVPFRSNDDRVDRQLGKDGLLLLKLHGCITRTTDDRVPLILTADQYATHRDNRDRLFNQLFEWGSEYSIVFVGHRVRDPNLRALLVELTRKLGSRPQYYLVRPGVEEVEKQLWASKRVTVVNATFEQFLQKLDAAIDKRVRPLLAAIDPGEHAINNRFTSTGRPSPALLEYLQASVEYVHGGLTYEGGSPQQFYRGFGLGWYPIREGLDVRRKLEEQFIQDVVIRPEEDRPSTVELYVIKAEAGAGKSVLLRRIAWESATQAGVLCLLARGDSRLAGEPLRELHEATGERVFLFVDNAADHLRALRSALSFAKGRKIPLTVVVTERINEWNSSCEDLEEFVSDDFRLRYLSEREIGTLVDLLEQHDSLGPNLLGKTREERVAEFVKRLGRQLLVALHEATRGEPFQEILYDEFQRIQPPEAQRIYLSVCVLNRLRVPVRAGLISRVHGVPFEEFRERLFGPLEHVVLVSELPWGDFAYRARHSEIAQIVFDRVLTDPSDRFNECVRLLKALNPMYSVDQESIQGLIKARSVNDLYPDAQDAFALYDAAEEVLGEDAHLLQQRANYERIRDDGNLKHAVALLERARQLDPGDSTIIHTLAEVHRKQAEASTKRLERTRLRGEARAVLRGIPMDQPGAKYAAVTKLKLTVDELRDLLEDADAQDRDIDEAIREADRAFESTRQRFPGDNFVLSVEADLGTLLKDSERSIVALERARAANPRDPFIASRLADLLFDRGEAEKAQRYLEEALESNAGHKRLNYQYAELLRKTGRSDRDELEYRYRRSFTKWDSNHASQFWFARFAFESSDEGKIAEAREAFKRLREAPMSFDDRTRVRDAIGGLESARRFGGDIARIEAAHGFASMDGRGDWVFFHKSDLEDDVWAALGTGDRVTFSVGFTLRGPKAMDLHIEGS